MALNLFDNSELIKEFYITYLFYSACGLRTQSRLKDILDTKSFKISVPKETELVINGYPGVYGEQFAKEVNSLMKYYLSKTSNFSKIKNYDDIEVKYIIRNEVWNGKLFKDTLEALCNNFKNIGIPKEEIESMFEYVGENGIRFKN